MTTVEIFKTNVCEPRTGQRLIKKLLRHYPEARINFDLEDCDRVLRVEGRLLSSEQIAATLQNEGFECEVLN
ncbi:hypothetical protein C8P68_102861 [Mucilaginibacter yixingensis]|uniref:Copper chaperone CopZ n=1 Tax=Mucilaginibacter yixingensis TaxID=1295612 RepID=A0A2T5JE39_9SPHI|nr:hypothetical protein [Mucilaginibacter yixingensis]PTR00030.1 hypothetical protein C8P68_102861 [Mucilaginibacter yixingensis]